MNKTQLTREERQETLNEIFNMIGAGFGESISPEISDDPMVEEYLSGKISLDELGDYFLDSAKKMKDE